MKPVQLSILGTLATIALATIVAFQIDTSVKRPADYDINSVTLRNTNGDYVVPVDYVKTAKELWPCTVDNEMVFVFETRTMNTCENLNGVHVWSSKFDIFGGYQEQIEYQFMIKERLAPLKVALAGINWRKHFNNITEATSGDELLSVYSHEDQVGRSKFICKECRD